jgi:segregation and condensation protein B
MEDTEVSVPETSVEEQEVASVEPEVAADEAITAGEVADADEVVAAGEVIAADEVVAAGEVVAADELVDAGDEVAAAGEVVNTGDAVVADEAVDTSEVVTAGEVITTDEVVAAEEAPSTDVAVIDEAPSLDAGARPEELRLLEAMLFAATEPLDEASLAKRMPEGVDVKAALAQLQDDYSLRGVNLIRVSNKWTFRTATDLSWLMTRESVETRRLSRAAIEMLAIIAYHQPVTRAEIEEIRGVVTSKGTLDVLMETGWIRPRGRRKTPGRPLTFGTTEAFLAQFSLEALGDLPGLEELKGSGLLDTRLPTGFSVPSPSDDPVLREDEDPLDPDDLDLTLAPAVEPEKGGES